MKWNRFCHKEMNSGDVESEAPVFSFSLLFLFLLRISIFFFFCALHDYTRHLQLHFYGFATLKQLLHKQHVSILLFFFYVLTHCLHTGVCCNAWEEVLLYFFSSFFYSISLLSYSRLLLRLLPRRPHTLIYYTPM